MDRIQALMVKKDSTKKVIDFLDGNEAEFDVREILILLHEDEVALSKSHPTE